MRKLLLFYLFITSTISFAQKEANNWYFGNYAGLNFGGGAPVALTNGQLATNEGCSSISDAAGNLLFYTDGIRVWNKNHTVMANGTNLKGDPSSTQSGIIVPKPGSSTIYYVFTVDMQGGQAIFPGGDADGVSNGFMYSEIDMTLNGGLGDVVGARKNVALKKPTTEGLSAVRHTNGVDYWVVTHGCNNNQYYAFLVTAAGVNPVPVQSNVGPNVAVTAGTSGSGAIGYMKISPNGKKIAACHGYENKQLVLSDFNAATGVVSNSITMNMALNGDSDGPYGVEFSTCNEYLYVSEQFTLIDLYDYPEQTRIWRFDLNAASIPASKTLFKNILDEWDGALQLAPDGNIYVARLVRTWDALNGYYAIAAPTLHRINNPRLPGATFTNNAVNLAGRTSVFGLPPFIASFFYNSTFSPVNVTTGDTSLFCKPDFIRFNGSTNTYDSIRWDFGDPPTGINNTATIINPQHLFSGSGSYTVRFYKYLCGFKDSAVKVIKVYQAPIINNLVDQTICPGSIVLDASGAPVTSYLWSTGAVTPTISVNTPGKYVVTASNNGCFVKDSMTLTFSSPVPVSVTIAPDKNNVCPGTSVTFTATPVNGGAAPAYQWFLNGNPVGGNSNTYTSTTFNNADVVTVRLTSNSACVTGNPATSVPVVMNISAPVPVSVTIAPDKNNICQGTNVTFTAIPVNGGAASAYQWFVNGNPVGGNSNTYSSTTLNNNDQVTVRLTSNANCVSGNPAMSAAVIIIISTPLVVSVTAAPDKNNICQGTSVTFTATPSNGGSAPSYQWFVNGNPVGSNSSTYTSTTLNNNDQVTVQLTSNLSCVSNNPATSTTVVMVVNPPSPVSVTVAPDKNNVCQGTNVIFTATPINGGAAPAYQWFLNGNPVGGNSNTYTSSTFNNNDLVTVQLTSNAVCISGNPATSPAVSMVINGPPVANAGIDKTLSCSSVTIGTAAVAGNSYSWTPAGGLNDPTIAQPDANLSNIYTLTVTNIATGCKATDAVTVNGTILIPVADAGADKSLTCSVISVSIGSAAVAGNTYLWSPAVGLSDPAIAQPSATSPGLYTLTVTNTTSGCNSTDDVLVSQTAIPPIADAGADKILTCSTPSVTIGAAAVAGNTYSWLPAAGLSNAGIAQPNASQPNVYTLTVTNIANGCTSTDSVIITRDVSLPVANAGVDQKLTCSLISVSIGASAVAGNTYAWLPATGLDNASTAQPNANQPNIYTLTVTNSTNGCTATDAVSISQDITAPVANAGADKVLTCTSPTAVIGSASVAGYTYSWSPTLGISDPLIAQPVVNAQGLYTLTVTNTANGCTTTDVVNISQNITPPLADAGPDKTLTCAVTSVSIGTLAVAGNSYSWSPSSGLTNATIAQPNATNPGTYTLTVTNSATGCTSTDAVNVGIDTLRPLANAGPDNTLTCKYPSWQLGSPSIAGNSYSWTPAAGLNNSSIAQPDANQPNIFTLTVTHLANGCTSTDAVSILKDITPPLADAGTDQLLTCTTLNVSIGSVAIAGNTYSWSPAVGLNNAAISQPTVNQPNIYTLTVTNTTNGCTATDAVNITQNIVAPPANAGADKILTCTVTSIPIGTPAVAGNTYLWSPAAGLDDATLAQPTSNQANVYTLTVTNTANGCTSTDAVTITKDIIPPLADAGTNQTLTCTATILPIGTTAVAGNSYSWSPATGLSNAIIAQPNASQPNVYTLTVTNNTNGCTASDAVTVTQNITPPVADAGGDFTLTCRTPTVSIGTPLAGGNSYAWLPASGLNNAAVAQPTANQPNVYTLTVTNIANGCTASDAVTINQDITPPTANAGADNIITCTSPTVGIGSPGVAGSTYLWAPAAGLDDPAIAQPVSNQPNIYTLTVTNTTNGCTATDAINVTKDITPPLADAGADKTITCAIPSTVIGTTAVAGNSYSWSPSGGLSNTAVAQPTATMPNLYTLTVTNNLNGCTSTDVVTVSQLISPPPADAGPDRTLTCKNPNYIMGTPAVAGNTYAWLPSAGLNDPSIAQPLVTAPGIYVLTVTNPATGCISVDTAIILSDTVKPIANAGADQLVTCTTPVVTLGIAAVPGNTYAWLPSAGLSNSAIAQPSTSTANIYSLTVTNTTNGCSSTNAVNISKDITPPTANAGSDQVINCTNRSVQLGSIAVAGNTYLWSPAAGLDNDSIAQPLSSATGTYTLTVTNPINGCTSADAMKVSIDTLKPSANAGADKVLTCSNLNVAIGIPAIAGNTYSWIPALGLNDSTLAQPNTGATGSFILTVTKVSNGCTSSDVVDITIDSIRPIADAGTPNTLTCVAKSFAIGAAQVAGNTYSWWPTAGLNNSSISNPTASAANLYTVTVKKNSNGCIATDAVSISIDTVRPFAFAGKDSTLTCAVKKLKLGSLPIAGNIYSWTPATGLDDASIAQPTTTEAYNYTLTVTNPMNGCESSDAVIIRQNLTTSQAVAGADLILTCTTSSFKIGSPGSVLNTYAWTPRSGLNDSTLAQPTVTKPGSYILTVTNNATGCTTDDRITISQDTLPPVADAGADQTLTCVAKSVTLGTPGSGNNTYAWKPSVALSAVNIAQPVARDTGTYYLKVTKNANGCRSWDTVAVLKDTIAPVADAGPDDSFSCPHVAMTLGSSSTPNYAYYWTRTAGLSSTDAAQPQTDLAGTFILSVINKINGCKSLPDSVVIYDKNCECTFYVPTAFSPNRDNVNDILTAFKYCDDFRDFSFSIFNRWGEEVYHTTELSEGWDGFYKSESIQDTYVWVIEYFDVLHNEKKIAKGSVVLLK